MYLLVISVTQTRVFEKMIKKMSKNSDLIVTIQSEQFQKSTQLFRDWKILNSPYHSLYIVEMLFQRFQGYNINSLS